MDRISELPDSLLTTLLSYLPTKSSVQTTLLSKHFQNRWVSVPNLIFPPDSTPQFINHCLLLWASAKTPHVHKLDIEFASPPKDLTVWLIFAVQHSVQNLRLVFGKTSWDNTDHFFTLPQHLFSNSSLHTLELGCCVLSPRAQVDWPCLKKLSVKCVRLSNELIKNLVSESGRLEVFEIFNCIGYDSLVLGSSSLKVLKICDNYEYSETPVTISAPGITKLCIGGVWYRKISFVCLTFLGDVELGFHYRTRLVKQSSYSVVYSYEYRVNDYIEKVVEMLHCHHSIERLVVDTMFIEAVTLAEVKTLPPQLSKCRSLTLRTITEKNVLKGILNFLKILPNLEVLILDMEFSDKWYTTGSDVESFLTKEVEERKILFQHLKKVKITSHMDRRPVFPFIKFLLENAPALETMSIFPKTASSYSIDYMFQLIQDLSDMPRSSPIAKVVLQKGRTKIQVEMHSCNFTVSGLLSGASLSKKPRTAIS